MSQPSLFDSEPSGDASLRRPIHLGHAAIEYRPAASILTRATGFMAAYDYTLNPYSGCSFGCTYCYAAFFARDTARRDEWGRWVTVKENALAKLKGMRTSLEGATVYMSSVTDPYQPIERRLGLVRDLLPILADRGVRLVVQTRSPLVARDVDLFGRFDAVRVNMTVTTDSEDVRRVMEPHCPTTRRRLDGIAAVAAAGVPACITMTPLLPVLEPRGFAADLLGTGVRRFVVQPFHATRGRFIAGTRAEALALMERIGWSDQRYRATVAELRRVLPHLDEGQAGFAPA